MTSWDFKQYFIILSLKFRRGMGGEGRDRGGTQRGGTKGRQGGSTWLSSSIAKMK